MNPYIYLFIFLYTYSSIYLTIYLPIYLSIYLNRSLSLPFFSSFIFYCMFYCTHSLFLCTVFLVMYVLKVLSGYLQINALVNDIKIFITIFCHLSPFHSNIISYSASFIIFSRIDRIGNDESKKNVKFFFDDLKPSLECIICFSATNIVLFFSPIPLSPTSPSLSSVTRCGCSARR